MMSQRSKRKEIKTIRPQFLRANSDETHKILVEIIETTVHHRNNSIRILTHSSRRKKS